MLHFIFLYFSRFYNNYKIDIKKLNKLGFSAYAAAALIHLLKKQLDAIGLSVFNENVFLQTPAKSTPVHIKLLYSELEKLLSAKPDDKVHKTDVIKSIHTIAESIHKRSLVIIFSDMFDNGHQSLWQCMKENLDSN